MDDCIFCKIVKGEIPSYKVYEDENFLAFMDIFPRVKGHTLVIPKKHYRWVIDVPEFGEYWEIVKKVALVVQKELSARSVCFLTLGDEVPHAHIHILPQTQEGKIEGVRFTEVKNIPKEEIAKIAEAVSQKFR